jgi:hypothetical protein
MKHFILLWGWLLFAIPSSAVLVTFRVDMTNQTVNGAGVHMAGNFANAGYVDWNPAGIQLFDGNSDNIYEVTLDLLNNTQYFYKFINGNSWGNDESVPGGCNNGGNRSYTTSTVNNVRPVICYGECGFCASNPQFRSVTFRVDMQNTTVSPNGVHMAGNFHFNPAPNTYPEWNPAGIALSDLDNDEVYEVTLQLAEGYNFQYKFVNGNAWGSDESVPVACNVGGNRFLSVGTAATQSLNEVCYASCTDCVPTPEQVDVTFRVNLQNLTVSPNGVHLAGGFGSAGYAEWNPGGIAMTDGNSDGIYEVTLTLTEGVSYAYKFVNGNAWGSDESVPGGCSVGGNRTFTASDINEVLSAVCYGSCSPCAAPPTTYPVTFRVNMQNETVSPNGVHIAGGFFSSGYVDWNPGAIALSDNNNDGIYEVTLNCVPGTIEYKFVNGNTWGNDESMPSTCSGNTNRSITVGTAPATTTAFCFGYCSDCASIPVNDARVNARWVNYTTFPSCLGNILSADLTNAVPSPGSETDIAAAPGSGHDVWYRFTATSEALRVQVNSASNDIALELQDAAGNTLAIEDAVQGVGGEILAHGGLTVSSVYYVLVRNLSTTSVGPLTVCMQRLNDSRCNMSTNAFNSLCTNYKVAYTGANQYVVHFTEVPTIADPVADVFTYTTPSASTTFSMGAVAGLNYSRSYEVSVDAIYQITDANSGVQTIVSESDESCTISIAAQPELNLRASDSAPNQRSVGSIVAADRWVCGASYYRWAITQTAPISGITVYVNGLAGNRFLPLAAVNAAQPGLIVPGGLYTIQVAPVFGSTVGDYGVVDQVLSIAGSAMPVFEDEMAEATEKSLVVANEAAFTLFPNPSSGEVLHLVAAGSEEGMVHVRVIDVQGRTVVQRSLVVSEAMQVQLTFEQPLETGMYLVEWMEQGQVSRQPWIVRR